MSREEMIRKVCEALSTKSATSFDSDSWQFFCVHCEVYNGHHSNDCPVTYARQLLAKPVIEVGDVVMNNKTWCEFEVVRIVDLSNVLIYETYHGNSFLRNKCHDINDLTLIRKGSHVSND